MNLQTLQFSNLNPTIFSSNSKFKSSSCNIWKRVSESSIVMKNNGRLSRIRCGGGGGDGEKEDKFYMRKAVELAKTAIGCTSPNPMVGCVLVKNGEIIGQGFHPKAGQPHAEVFALREAGDKAENATAYVSLEPCNHFGRTPPCSEALIRAKVNRVVVGMVDPNPIVASRGVEKLRDAGIDVTVAVEEELCKNLNEAYIHRMLTGKPFVTLRYSLSVNGKILDKVGLAAKEPGGYYSQLLQAYDGVILSSGSLTRDFTFPTSQEPQAKQPLRIIVARTTDSPLQIPILTNDAANQVIIFAENDTVVNPETTSQGVETVVMDKVNLNAILDYCASRGLCSVLVDYIGDYKDLEELVEEGLEQGLVQKVVMEVLPVWEGRKESEILTTKKLEREVRKLKKLQSTISNESVLVEGYF
ncbi:hypothetical protein MKW98_004866 [Papaver atlanticum]|uniref:Riboflavin biosynthesis protein PYRD, chloroplastic n=1 Tax=Papaver atlanticum TaxID=357466 RepID=A0AAD4RXS5_9MAGN|nr:hypothetical protein MKW98_004866 [Papaver atlanticum]